MLVINHLVTVRCRAAVVGHAVVGAQRRWVRSSDLSRLPAVKVEDAFNDWNKDFSLTPKEAKRRYELDGVKIKGKYKRQKRKLVMRQVVKDMIAVHGNKYDYTLVDYHGLLTDVTIRCPVHGRFRMPPQLHICERRGCPLCQFRLDKSRYRMQAKLEGVTYDEIFNRGRALADPTSPYNVERVSRADTRLLERIIEQVRGRQLLVLVGDGEEPDTARILVKMTLEASRLGMEHVVGLSVEDLETAEHIARAVRASVVQAGVNSDSAASVLPYEGAIRQAGPDDALVIFATDIHGVLAVASSLLHRPCLPIVLCYPAKMQLKERLMATPATSASLEFSEDDPTAYGRLAVLTQMGWTAESVVEPPVEEVPPIEAGDDAELEPSAAVAVQDRGDSGIVPVWLRNDTKKKTGGVLLAARGWQKPEAPEPFHPLFDTVVLLHPRELSTALDHDDLMLTDALLRMCFADELTRSRPVAKYAGRLWPLADMQEVFEGIGKDPKSLPGDLAPDDWERLIVGLTASERKHEEEEEGA
ncbi:hypothetical protein FOL47_007929 [Perkinsus chesapeaki]|uniref:Uncharacterized protein n=1 Tax=Perkinsus chesapeaki TaxID=330153 RepID=A0A7J6MUM7_PERCH|nr:hypothetical protein FOL47_007929 [Perkinsus chesapeaki]